MRKLISFSIVTVLSFFSVFVVISAVHESVTAQRQEASPAFLGDMARLAGENTDFRHVLYTSENLQLVLMTLPPGESIGRETHDGIDQCIFVIEGEGQVVLDGEVSPFVYDEIACVPAGTEHDVRNSGETAMRLFTIYAPPEHAPGTVHATRAEAEEAERAED